MLLSLYYSNEYNQVTTEVINTFKSKLDIIRVESKEPNVPHKYLHDESKMIVKDISSYGSIFPVLSPAF